MASASGRYVMVYNGEIYNFRELVQRYGLHDLHGRSDSEVLLELYERLGSDVVRVIRGMYAFVVYDRKKNTFFGARDTFGIKPLYYLNSGDGYVFSSEIKPLLALAGGAEIHRPAVLRYLADGVLDDTEETFFEGIRQVPPGYVVEGSREGISLKKGCLLNCRMDEALEGEKFREHYHELLLDKTSQYLYSDVPVGVSLSGGFDSSLLAYLIHARHNGQPLHMFSRGYEGFDGNELEDAKRIGEKFGFRYHEAILAAQEIPGLLEKFSGIQEHPVTSISILAFHKLYEVAQKTGLKVLLEGHGGDEIWAGYAYYRNCLQDKATHGLSHDGSSFRVNYEILKESPDGGDSRLAQTVVADPQGLTDLQKQQLGDMFGGKLQRALRFVDRASMSRSMEVRLPFLDVDVAQRALAVPDRCKVNENGHRDWIRRMAERHLGRATAFRKKVPVQDPQRLWLQTSLKDYVGDTLGSDNLWISEYIHMDRLRHHVEEFMRQPERYANLTFIVFPLFLEAWHNGMKQYLKSSICELT